MKRLFLLVRKTVFWVGLPVLWIYLRGRTRTRVLIICGDEFLVLRQWYTSGSWILPGGGLHKGEASLPGLIREVQEETGIALDKKDVGFLFSTQHHDKGISFKYDCYAALLPAKPAVKPQKYEIAEYAWIPLKNPGLRLAKDVQHAVAYWLNKG